MIAEIISLILVIIILVVLFKVVKNIGARS